MNACTSLTVSGVLHSITVLTFAGSIANPSVDRIMPNMRFFYAACALIVAILLLVVVAALHPAARNREPLTLVAVARVEEESPPTPGLDAEK